MKVKGSRAMTDAESELGFRPTALPSVPRDRNVHHRSSATHAQRAQFSCHLFLTPAVFAMSRALPFVKEIIQEIAPPDHDDLLIIAKGLGLRRIVATMLKIYDGPRNLVLLVSIPV